MDKRSLPLDDDTKGVEEYVDDVKRRIQTISRKIHTVTQTVTDLPEASIEYIVGMGHTILSHAYVFFWWGLKISFVVGTLIDDMQAFPIHFDYHHMFRSYSEQYLDSNLHLRVNQVAPHLMPPVASNTSTILFSEKNISFRLPSDPAAAFLGKESAQAIVPLARVASSQAPQELAQDPKLESKLVAQGFNVDVTLRMFVPRAVPAAPRQPQQIYLTPQGLPIFVAGGESHADDSRAQWVSPVMLTAELVDRSGHVVATSIRPAPPPPVVKHSIIKRFLKEAITLLPSLLIPAGRNGGPFGDEEGEWLEVIFFEDYPVPSLQKAFSEGNAPSVAVLTMAPALEAVRDPHLLLTTRLTGVRSFMRNNPLLCGGVFAWTISVANVVVLFIFGLLIYARVAPPPPDKRSRTRGASGGGKTKIAPAVTNGPRRDARATANPPTASANQGSATANSSSASKLGTWERRPLSHASTSSLLPAHSSLPPEQKPAATHPVSSQGPGSVGAGKGGDASAATKSTAATDSTTLKPVASPKTAGHDQLGPPPQSAVTKARERGSSSTLTVPTAKPTSLHAAATAQPVGSASAASGMSVGDALLSDREEEETRNDMPRVFMDEDDDDETVLHAQIPTAAMYPSDDHHVEEYDENRYPSLEESAVRVRTESQPRRDLRQRAMHGGKVTA